MNIDPELLPAIERHRAAWPVPGHRLALTTWRQRYEEQVAAARPPRPAGLGSEDREVGRHRVRVRIYRPSISGPLPAVIYLHGGGWVIGSIESHDDITAAIASEAGCVVLSVDYSRAPEQRFPRAFEEVTDTVQWLTAEAADAGIDPQRLLVAGDSAGGNLAAAAALWAGELGFKLSGQVLLYPCMDTDFARPSYRDGRDAPFLSSEQMQWFWHQYLGSESIWRNRFAVPMRASDRQLALMPPTYIATAEHDPLRDEGAAFAARLLAADVPVDYEPGQGLVHGFIRHRGFASEPARIWSSMCQWIQRHGVLQRGGDRSVNRP